MDVKIISDGSGMGTKVFKGDTELRGVSGIEIDSINGPGDLVTARLRFDLVRLDVTARGTEMLMLHPETGAMQEVASIKFADGTEYVF